MASVEVERSAYGPPLKMPKGRTGSCTRTAPKHLEADAQQAVEACTKLRQAAMPPGPSPRPTDPPIRPTVPYLTDRRSKRVCPCGGGGGDGIWLRMRDDPSGDGPGPAERGAVSEMRAGVLARTRRWLSGPGAHRWSPRALMAMLAAGACAPLVTGGGQ